MRLSGLAVVLAVSLALAPLAVGAQQAGRVYRIGYLSPSPPETSGEVFRQALRELGWIEGRNIAFEYRWAHNDYARLPGLAKELVALNPDVIFGTSPPAALALKEATKTIAVVFLGGPAVESGLVASLARPGGNLTGVDVLAADLNVKRLDLLKGAIPTASQIAVLSHRWSQAGAAQQSVEAVDLAARTLGLQPRFLEVRHPNEIDTAFAIMARERPHALLVMSSPMLASQSVRIVDLAARNRLPAMYQWREFAEVGGLMSYGANRPDLNRRAAVYVDKILRGAKPGDLPVEQAAKFELVINLKTAKTLGLAIPPSLLLRADQVLE
jgi:putative tryptophan/tyrosine transport system substrate-binding protein